MLQGLQILSENDPFLNRKASCWTHPSAHRCLHHCFPSVILLSICNHIVSPFNGECRKILLGKAEIFNVSSKSLYWDKCFVLSEQRLVILDNATNDLAKLMNLKSSSCCSCSLFSAPFFLCILAPCTHL